jgi:Leucine-rich repeat (LRR) protein
LEISPVSDLARQLIAENKRTRSISLDLGKCGLTEIPPEVGELVWLESLTVASDWYEWEGQGWMPRGTGNSAAKNVLLVNIGPLGKLLHLRLLVLEEVSDLAPLAGLVALETLIIKGGQVTDLAPLARLSALQSLFVSAPRVTDLGPLARLSALRSLNVSDTPVTDLAPLARLSALQSLAVSGTGVTDLTPIAGLSALQYLDIYKTEIADLTPLVRLSALQSLDLWKTRVTDLAPLTGLSALQRLDLWETQVADLAPLAHLSALQYLRVSNTRVTDLEPLTHLSALQHLNVTGTQVTDLSPLAALIARGCPVQWSSEWWKGDGIYIEDCPLKNPPPEIARQGNEAILNYFRERAQGEVDHLYEAKMLILGEGGSGKTSLLRRLYQPGLPLPTEKETTKGIAIYRHEFEMKNGRRFRLNVWDFGGQEIYHATHQFFLTRRSLYLLVDDTRKDHKSVSDEGFKYWLDLIDVFGGHSPVLIFQNEKGGRSKAIDIAGIKGRYDNVKELYGGNLEHADAARPVHEGIEFFAANLSHIGEELPSRWIDVRAEIEKRAGEVSYIPQEEYFRIYGRHLEFDRSRALHLSRYLHDLGVFLHFQDDPLLARTVILQNQWATEAVFRILDDEI